MATYLQEAIDDLYRIAVTEGKSQSPSRLRSLAGYMVAEFEARGLFGCDTEQLVPGGGRPKDWDVAWKHDAKYRLAVSLKSILKNLAGTVPNRIDDLMGETANVQLHSPEIVVGYVMVLNVADDKASRKHESTYSDLIRKRLSSLAGRCPPAGPW